MFDHINVPADLDGVTDDDLTGLADQVRAAAAEISDEAASSDEGLTALEGLAQDHQRITDEIAARDEARSARADRVAAALERIGEPAASDSEPDSGDDTDDTDEDGANPAADPTDTPDTVETPDDEPAAEDTPVPVAAAADDHTTTTAAPQEDPVTDQSVPAPVAPADPVAALTAARPAHTAPPATTSNGGRRPVATFHNTGAINANERGDELDTRGLARLIAEQARRFARATGAGGPIILAHAEVDWDEQEQITAGDVERNFAIMENAGKRWEAIVASGPDRQALVASGANCALLTPNYDIPTWAQAMSPVEDFLPTVGAPRGGIRYVQPPTWSQAYTGVRVTTGAQDAAGYTTQNPAGPTAPKPCVRLSCPPPLECTVDAVSACVELGNLQSMTFPELINVFTDHLAVAQAQVKEIYYLDGIDAGSTEVNFTGTYGATRSIVHAYALAAHAMRKRLHMPLDAAIDVLVPDTLVPLIRVDMVNDLNMGLGFLQEDPETVARALFSALRLNVTWYYDYSADVGARGAMQIAQAAGTLNNFPATYRSWMFPPGTWVRLDGGTLDIGMFRDSDLVETNDYRIFAEEWVQVCKRGGESVALDITVCPNGTAPSSVSAFTCTS
jgi:hypothetical protein